MSFGALAAWAAVAAAVRRAVAPRTGFFAPPCLRAPASAPAWLSRRALFLSGVGRGRFSVGGLWLSSPLRAVLRSCRGRSSRRVGLLSGVGFLGVPRLESRSPSMRGGRAPPLAATLSRVVSYPRNTTPPALASRRGSAPPKKHKVRTFRR